MTSPPLGMTRLRAGDEIEVAFTDLLANGQAVGRADGVVVFCFGPLPLERARVTIVALNRSTPSRSCYSCSRLTVSRASRSARSSESAADARCSI